jgi:hypothetical protein
MGAERSAGHAVHIKGELLLDVYISKDREGKEES